MSPSLLPTDHLLVPRRGGVAAVPVAVRVRAPVRARVLQRYPDANEAEFFLRFSKAPAIGDIRIKKIKDSEYEFEAVDAFSTNEDGWLVNCQWDFDYQEGHFAADKDYVLSRDKVKDKKRGEIFKAILKARHIFEKSGEFTVACRVQDNLAGETIFSKKISIP